MDVLGVFDLIDLVHYNMTDQNMKSNSDKYWVTDMAFRMMMLETRPSYPSNRLTFAIANITRDKDIRFLNIYLTLNGQFNIDLTLEDSKRNFYELFACFSDKEINVL